MCERHDALMYEVRLGSESDAAGCVHVLRALPDYFTDAAYVEFVDSVVGKHPLWVAVSDETVIGFVLAEQRYAQAAEITFAAVAPAHRSMGVGKRLVTVASGWLATQGVRFVEVKTLDESAGYEPYVATRAFWEACGFVQIDCINPLPGWSPGNPSAIYVAAIG